MPEFLDAMHAQAVVIPSKSVPSLSLTPALLKRAVLKRGVSRTNCARLVVARNSSILAPMLRTSVTASRKALQLPLRSLL
jgi:hypothetical protein